MQGAHQGEQGPGAWRIGDRVMSAGRAGTVTMAYDDGRVDVSLDDGGSLRGESPSLLTAERNIGR